MVARLASAALLLAGIGLVGCTGSVSGSADNSSRHGPTVTIRIRDLPHYGDVLVDSSGYVLYMFQPDAQKQVTCTGLCAATWPPQKIPAGASLVAAPGVRQSLLSSDADPAGGRVVTYDGWPLYTYTGDVSPGQATGEGIDLNGGDWFLMRPSGQPITFGPLQ
jgi:predicted lipoprotein with Yx(FWY)xxD motif